jgi:hypothetical protein
MRIYLFVLALSFSALSCNKYEVYTFECGASTETVNFTPPKNCHLLRIQLLEENRNFGTLILKDTGDTFKEIQLSDYKNSELIFDYDWYGSRLGIEYRKNHLEPDCEGLVKLKIMFFRIDRI